MTAILEAAIAEAEAEGEAAWERYERARKRCDYLDSIPDSTQAERDAAADERAATFAAFIEASKRYWELRDQQRAQAAKTTD